MIAAPDEFVQVLRANGETILPPYQVTGLPSGPRERAVAIGARLVHRDRATSAAGASAW